MRLIDKVGIVTGGSKGIGQAIAIAFAKEGARVVICRRASSKDEGEAVVNFIQEAEGEAVYIQADVSDMAEAQHVIEETVARWGRLDVLCNNAGVGMLRTVEETTAEEWRNLLSINLDGVFHCSKFAIPAMRRTGAGVLSTSPRWPALLGSCPTPPIVPPKAAY